MVRFFENHRRKIMPIMVSVVIATSFILNINNMNASLIENVIGVVVTPFQDVVSSIDRWVSTANISTKEKNLIIDENADLMVIIEELEADNKRLQLYEEENEKLSKLLDTASKYPRYKTIGANIISKSTGIWYQTFVVNKGIINDVSANMVLITNDGLVGKITESGYNYSTCLSIIDARSSVSVKSARTNELGIVKGDYLLMQEGLCKMEYILSDAEISIGDEIVTSQLSDVYPEGLPIGKVTELKIAEDGVSKYAIIKPYVDFKNLDSMLILDKDNVAEDTLINEINETLQYYVEAKAKLADDEKAKLENEKITID